MDSTSDARYLAARERIEQRLGLVAHWVAFVAVNLALAIAYGFEPAAGYLWGWGIGLGAHSVYVMGQGSQLKQRLIERELERDAR